MLANTGLSALLTLALSAMVAQAQDWDVVKAAKGWARLDATGTATFYDPATQQLTTWMKDAGIMAQVDISKAEMVPERWVVDDDRIWIMAGTTMKQMSKTGQVLRTVKLPAEVADADFLPPDGLAISYRTTAPFIERRELKNGSEVWTYGNKPKKGEVATRTRHRIFRNDENNIVLVSHEEIPVTLLDGKKGGLLGQAVFTYNDGAPPTVALGDKERGSSVCWWGKAVAFSVLPASALPSLNQQGLMLVRMDFASSTVDFLPTGLAEGATLAGILEDRAAFVAHNGGMVFIPIK